MNIIIPGADFSGLGLGSTDFVINYADLVGISDPAKITAMRNLYNGAKSAGLWDRLDGVCFFPGNTAATQKHIFREDFPELIFSGSGNHANGYKPVSGSYYTTPFIPTAGEITALALGVYTTEADQASTACLLGSVDPNTPTSREIGVYRYFGAKPVGVASLNSPVQLVTPGSYSSTSFGFLQFSYLAGNYRLVDGGTEIRSVAKTGSNPLGGGSVKLVGGARGTTTTPDRPSIANQIFAYWTKTNQAFTLAEMQSWNTLVQTFLSAFGRV